MSFVKQKMSFVNVVNLVKLLHMLSVFASSFLYSFAVAIFLNYLIKMQPLVRILM